MKKLSTLLPVLLGGAGCLLRFFQRRTVFTSDGLARPHPLSALLALVLLATALSFLLTAWKRQGKQLTFFHSFALPEGQPPFDLVCGALLFVAAGALLLVRSVGGGNLVPLIFAALAVLSGVTLLLFLRAWRSQIAPGSLLLPPVLLALIFLLTTYQRFASYPVTTAFYVPVLAQAALALTFYQIAAHAFAQGKRRDLWWSLPVAIVLSLTALPDAEGLPQAGLYLAGALCLFAFWRCLGEYTPPETEREEERDE